ncbi:MAG: radical SAM protein [Desulfobacteraceae bacterium]|nr:radical SAM protein [Desulfobacteraceae bacterium]
MAKILLVNPVIRQTDRPRHVPYGLAQLAAIVSKAGHQVQVFDCGAWRPTEEQIRTVLRADTWEAIGIGGLVTSYGYIKQFLALARQECPESLLILGGGVLTPIPRDIMALIPQVDVGVIGEGYQTLPAILDKLDEDKSRDFSKIKGVVWRDEQGEITINAGRDLLADLDSLPFPAWEMFPLEIYFANSSLLLSEEAMGAKRRLEFCCSYGCPYQCKYCFHLGLSGELAIEPGADGRLEVNITHQRNVRFHSPDYVVALASYARDRFGVDFISFLDENFVALDRFSKGKWMDEFEALWLKADLQPQCCRTGEEHADFCRGVHWGTTCHASLAKQELLQRLKNLGCSHLDFGFESFSDQILKEAGKGATKKMNIDALKSSMSVGIRAIPNQIMGFPGDDFDSILENLEVWQRLGIKAYPFLATPYPGSEWYFTYHDRILEQYDGSLDAFLLDLGDATTLTAVISRNFSGVELLGLRELLAQGDSRKIERYRAVWNKNRQQHPLI